MLSERQVYLVEMFIKKLMEKSHSAMREIILQFIWLSLNFSIAAGL